MEPLSIPYLTQRAHELTFDELLSSRKAAGYCTPEGYAITGFVYPPDQPIFWVKFGNRSQEAMFAETRTQQFALDNLEKIPKEEREGIHIPRIFRILKEQQRIFVVMELVNGKRLDEIGQSIENFYESEISDPYFDKITRALRLFLSFPVPPDTKPGPCGWGGIRHVFFKDQQAPVPYISVDELEEHVNNLATWFCKDNPTVTFERELHLVYADLHLGNFMFTDTSELYVIDFEHASFLPLSFMAFVIRYPSIMSGPVSSCIEDKFKDLPGDNLEVMARVSGLMGMSASRLGHKMNWTEGNLARHTRGRGHTRDLTRQRQNFASARRAQALRSTTGASSKPARAPAEEIQSSFFRDSCLPSKDRPQEDNHVRKPSKAKETTPILTAALEKAVQRDTNKRKRGLERGQRNDDDLEAKRRRLLAMPDWAGLEMQEEIERLQTLSDRRWDRSAVERGGDMPSHLMTSQQAWRRRSKDKTPPAQEEVAPGGGSCAPRLRHPRPIRHAGQQLVKELESSTGALRSSVERGEKDDDNLLPLCDELPDVTVRLDYLDDSSVAEYHAPSVAGGSGTGHVVRDVGCAIDEERGSIPSRDIACGERIRAAPDRPSLEKDEVPRPPLSESDDVSLTALLSDDDSISADEEPRLDPKYVGEESSSRSSVRGMGSASSKTGSHRPSDDKKVERVKKQHQAADETPGPLLQKDTEDEWLNFIFNGDGADEARKRAFDIAKRDTARLLAPSLPSSSGRETAESAPGDSDAGATCGTDGHPDPDDLLSEA
ncbi:hypothetical protein SAPIO_CDS2634 [Scedosporium apiospermum]|uniref:Aminoglycoside phosphotransferase domain-containing protein n=1 Tax=Pseudallescheria apiosperma TaxID=563466 RepID=A0A084GCX0_PSEDA|nr:uncharacterized protein SAPIO_CDS2634 [Scedosporium apiospermum]KEZ45182.1 hypothetical protein SAPIO_CDS2634 [Scedosporium apiospermum]